MTGPHILVRGAGVAGMVTAVALAEHGAKVTVHDTGGRVGAGASWFAGGMLAPWCEAESAPDEVTQDSLTSLDWWKTHVPDVMQAGSLVVAPPRDTPELARFGRRTSHFETIGVERIRTLEPDLEDRFDKALFFAEEGHVDPRKALQALADRLVQNGGTLLSQHPADEALFDWTVDCTGVAARNFQSDLRGMRGEMVLLRCPEITLHRPIRMLHPRIPVYIVPRDNSVFMVGATMVESDDTRAITVRAITDLLNAAYTLHPAFAEAELLEANAGLRPAYPDNVPRVRREGNRISLNGMYRHGFLLSPARAKEVCDIIFGTDRA
ncbi:glycine oxidase ThiO [Gluconobacter thailandicus]|uniref:D-amino-acid oxidase n=1 Tax=Gluconobacter thailandicus TaxID=257438 RepID=A0AAP9JIP6_GLUTH|nr:glycine oxidase ThiO [Gluconobacter thailandicus]QEH97412.1 glycine oxidase ThiO [Gluconobacter thailandicus]